VLRGRAVEDEGAPPLWPWRRILDAVGGDGDGDGLTGDLGGVRGDDLAAARFRAAAAAADSLIAAAAADGLLIVLEDLHWADHASLFLLRELTAEPPPPGCWCWPPAGRAPVIPGGPRWETWPGYPACR